MTLDLKRGRKHLRPHGHWIFFLPIRQAREWRKSLEGYPAFERSDEVIRSTLNYILTHLKSGNYLKGTRYYPSPDTFLFFASRLSTGFPEFERVLGPEIRGALATRSRMMTEPSRFAGQPDDPNSPLNPQRAPAASPVPGLQ